jgi:hypothetical protein
MAVLNRAQSGCRFSCREGCASASCKARCASLSTTRSCKAPCRSFARGQWAGHCHYAACCIRTASRVCPTSTFSIR